MPFDFPPPKRREDGLARVAWSQRAFVVSKAGACVGTQWISQPHRDKQEIKPAQDFGPSGINRCPVPH